MRRPTNRTSTVEIGERKSSSSLSNVPIHEERNHKEEREAPSLLKESKLSMEDDHTWNRAHELSRSVKKNPVITIKTKPQIEDAVFKPFPNPFNALFKDFLGWADKSVYFILYNKEGKDGRDYRHFHRDCIGKDSNISQSEMINHSKRYPVLILDLSLYPILTEEEEWYAYLNRYYPTYRVCTCPLARYALNGDGMNRQYYRLSKPYFYLTGLNQEGEECLFSTRLARACF